MAHQFSPIKCMSWWLVLKCLIVAAIAFIIGRWIGSYGTVTIKATYLGETQDGAEVTRGEQSVGTTPCTIRGKRGETISITVSYEDTQQQDEFKLKRGRQVHMVQLVPEAAQRMRLTFRGFDTNGDPVPDVYMWSAEGTPPELAISKRPVAMKTHDVGTEVTIDFKSADRTYSKRYFGPEKVVWSDKTTYDQWVREGLPQKLAALDKGYNNAAWVKIAERLLKESSDVGHEFPVIFLAPGHTPSGGGSTTTPTGGIPGGGTTGGNSGTGAGTSGTGATAPPNAAIPYSITSTRKLTAADIQGKSKEAHRLTRNELFARHGYQFESAELSAHFKKFPWYQPKTKNVDLVGIEDYNSDFLKQHE